ncbi:hypothetical protein [Ilumatobacter nonamiensis]|uniref:hypothetical protein n=1 Tax=Ilumatobacter nonamiensis TaxID=467093 RepID=UPI00034806ED|nr:hypothetical protein [Ilumatobacter nonamiensis]
MTTAADAGLDEQTDRESVTAAREPSRKVRVALTAIVIVPFVTAVVRAVRNDWFPIGDNALLFIRTRDVWTDDHPFLGSWTSASLSVGEHMNNPGAMYDWLVAPFAHLFPPGPAAALGVAAINIAMVCVISAVSHRVGGWSFQRWALLATALMAWSMGSELLIDIFQANALIFSFSALLIVAIGIASGDDGLLPLAAVISTLLLQTHISYAYIFVFIVVGVVGVRVWLRREIESPHWRRSAIVTTAVLVVLWAPSFWEQFFGPGKGNMSRLLGNSSGGDFSLGLSDATRIIGSLGVRPPFWGRSGFTTTVEGTRITETPDGPSLEIAGLLPLGVASLGIAALAIVLVALTIVARRARRRTQAAGGVVALVVLLGSILALSRLTIGSVGLSPHHVRWAWPLLAFVHLVIVWLGIAAWRGHRSSETVRMRQVIERTIDAAVFVLIGLVSLLNVPFLAQPSGPTADHIFMPTMSRIEPQLEQLDGFDPVLYDVSTLRVFEPYSSTMMMWLQEQGIELRVDDEVMIRQLGEARRADGSEPTRMFQLEGVAAQTYDGTACLLAEANLLTPDDDAFVRELLSSATAGLAESTQMSPDDAFDALVRREVSVFESHEQELIDTWIDTTFALFVEGDICRSLPA